MLNFHHKLHKLQETCEIIILMDLYIYSFKFEYKFCLRQLQDKFKVKF